MSKAPAHTLDDVMSTLVQVRDLIGLVDNLASDITTDTPVGEEELSQLHTLIDVLNHRVRAEIAVFEAYHANLLRQAVPS